MIVGPSGVTSHGLATGAFLYALSPQPEALPFAVPVGEELSGADALLLDALNAAAAAARQALADADPGKLQLEQIGALAEIAARSAALPYVEQIATHPAMRSFLLASLAANVATTEWRWWGQATRARVLAVGGLGTDGMVRQ